MKHFLCFLAGAAMMLVIGATSDDAMRDMAASLKRIATSLEKIAGQPQK